MPTRRIATTTLVLLVLAGIGTARAQQDHATPQEVVQRVRQAAQEIAKAGDAALPTFTSRNATSVWKDTYVFVLDCETGRQVGQPVAPERIGMELAAIKGEAGKPYALEMCAATRRPAGAMPSAS